MRIISGSARGTKLYSLEGEATRPTLDRIKESVFNILHGRIPEAEVLDLFAGSGSLGLECASRGAKEVILCDKAKEAIQIIEKNREKTRLQDNTKVYQMDFKQCLVKQEKEFDIIFLDPPYESHLIKEAVQEIVKMSKLKPEGILVAETEDEERIQKEIAEIPEIKVNDVRKYGRVKVVFLTRKG